MSADKIELMIARAFKSERARVAEQVKAFTLEASRLANDRGEMTLALALGRALTEWLESPEAPDDIDASAAVAVKRTEVRCDLDRITGRKADKARVDLIMEAIRGFLAVRQGGALTADVIDERARNGAIWVSQALDDYQDGAPAEERDDTPLTTNWKATA